MKPFRLGAVALTALATCLAVFAQTPQPPPAVPPPAIPPVPAGALPAPKPEKSQWVFSILPKSLQKNPNVDLTVITEMTAAGKKQPAATPQHPVYYITQSSGYHQMGEAIGGEHTLKQEDVDRLLKRALAANGFLPAEPPAHLPTLVVFYTWGSHNLLTEGDADNPTLSPNQVARNLLDRAALVGGAKFADEMKKLFQETSDLASAGAMTPPDPTGSGGPSATMPAMAFLNPINQYRMDPKHDSLFEQFTNDVYYVVASAYDYADLAKKERVLYWRTRMTVAAQGVSQEQTLPTVIAAAAPYFGRDMPEAEILTRRAVPDGKVEIGTPTVVEGAGK